MITIVVVARGAGRDEAITCQGRKADCAAQHEAYGICEQEDGSRGAVRRCKWSAVVRSHRSKESNDLYEKKLKSLEKEMMENLHQVRELNCSGHARAHVYRAPYSVSRLFSTSLLCYFAIAVLCQPFPP